MRIETGQTADTDDREYAACIAAVYALLQDESKVEKQASRHSAWSTAALLEGLLPTRAVRPPAPAAGRSLWSAAARLLLSLSLILSPGCAPAAGADGGAWPVPGGAAVWSDSGMAGDAYRPLPIRVGLVVDGESVTIAAPDGAELSDRRDGRVAARLSPGSAYTAGRSGVWLTFAPAAAGSLAVAQPAAGGYMPVGYTAAAACPAQFRFRLAPPAASPPASPSGRTDHAGVLVTPSGEDGLLSVNGRLFRGSLEIFESSKKPGRICAVNVVDLEDYLLSVVPSEMPGSWPAEALKAQAIAARSYAVASLGKHESEGFDVRPTVEDQVYAGVSAERDETNRAVAETCGIVLKHGNSVVPAFFHSTSGGGTEDAEHVWGKPVPYIKAVADYDDDSPHFTWTRAVDLSALDNALNKSGRGVGALLYASVLSRSASGRVRDILVAGSESSRIITGESMRRLANLPSTNFNLEPGPDRYVFAGRGFGHGLGLCQWGARRLAEHGYNAAQILAYYYKDVAIDYR